MHGYVKQKKKVSKTTVAVFFGKTKDKIAPCIFFLNTDLDWHNVSPSL